MARPQRSIVANDEVAALAQGLQALRRSADLTLKELSQRCHYSVTALSEATSGKKLPSLSLLHAFVDACNGNVKEWERQWRAAKGEAETTPSRLPLPTQQGKSASAHRTLKAHGRRYVRSEATTLAIIILSCTTLLSTVANFTNSAASTASISPQPLVATAQVRPVPQTSAPPQQMTTSNQEKPVRLTTAPPQPTTTGTQVESDARTIASPQPTATSTLIGTVPATASPRPLAVSTWIEVVKFSGSGVMTWSPETSHDGAVVLSPESYRIPPGTRVLVVCTVLPSVSAKSSTPAYYLLIGPGRWRGLYAATSDFVNGETANGLNYDPTVPGCISSTTGSR